VIDWFDCTSTIYSLQDEIRLGAERISEIVQALKAYIFMDQAPIQDVDIHEGLDNTLVILRNKLQAGITVHREYGTDLPRVEAYGSELNQVWTNIIDNAIYALHGRGEITVRTRREGQWVICYSIILEKHKGRLDVHSEPGKTCFEVRLPLHLAPEAA